MLLFEGCVISVFILCVLFLHIRSLPLASYLTFITLILIYLNVCLLVVLKCLYGAWEGRPWPLMKLYSQDAIHFIFKKVQFLSFYLKLLLLSSQFTVLAMLLQLNVFNTFYKMKWVSVSKWKIIHVKCNPLEGLLSISGHCERACPFLQCCSHRWVVRAPSNNPFLCSGR